VAERYFEFRTEKKKREKVKLMLWIEKDTLNRLELLRPEKLTIQECIRQILDSYLADPDI
jgi:hypothetical protein